MPVRCTVEIGRNSVPDRFAAILANNSRQLVQHQRGAVCRTEHGTRKTSPAIADYNRQRTGKFARFAAQLQITPASTCRQLWNAHAFDDLVGGEVGLEDPGRKL